MKYILGNFNKNYLPKIALGHFFFTFSLILFAVRQLSDITLSALKLSANFFFFYREN